MNTTNKNYIVVEASELVDNKCPKCDVARLSVNMEYRDREGELTHSDCVCKNCFSFVRIYND